MIERLVKEAGRNPAAVLALTGVVGGLLIAGARAGRQGEPDAGQGAADGADTLGERATALAREGTERVEDGARAVRERLPGSAPRSRLDDLRDNAAALGLTEKSVAVFTATFIAKSVGSYLRWRGEQQARLQAEALASADGASFPERLEEHTVAELRRMAAEREIEGRSSMNKDELIEALGEA